MKGVDKQPIEVYVEMPEGYMATGEFRPPLQNETYLAIDSDGDWVPMSSARDHAKDAPQIILMLAPKKRRKK